MKITNKSILFDYSRIECVISEMQERQLSKPQGSLPLGSYIEKVHICTIVMRSGYTIVLEGDDAKEAVSKIRYISDTSTDNLNVLIEHE